MPDISSDPEEERLKQAGLAASKDEDSGSRFSMGNIDDPTSEAYKRFGAGRGRASAIVPRPSIPYTPPEGKIVPRPSIPYTPPEPEYRSDPYVAMTQAQRDARPTLEEATAKRLASEKQPAAKTPVVSAAELKSSGFDNLRDYLNNKRGLSRKKDKDPTAGNAKDKAAQAAIDSIDPGSDYWKSGKATVDRQNAEAGRYAKGGSVKGWGKARGARAAKIV